MIEVLQSSPHLSSSVLLSEFFIFIICLLIRWATIFSPLPPILLLKGVGHSTLLITVCNIFLILESISMGVSARVSGLIRSDKCFQLVPMGGCV